MSYQRIKHHFSYGSAAVSNNCQLKNLKKMFKIQTKPVMSLIVLTVSSKAGKPKSTTINSMDHSHSVN